MSKNSNLISCNEYSNFTTLMEQGDEKLISEMKREALQSLKGKWGLGVGTTSLYLILNWILGFLLMVIIIMPFALLSDFIKESVNPFQSESLSTISIVLAIILVILVSVVNCISTGITLYGYSNTILQLRRDNATIDSLFEGFRGFRRMLHATKAMFFIFLYTGSWIPSIIMGFSSFFEETDNFGILSLYTILLLASCVFVAIRYFSYAMTYFIMIDYPEYSALQAMKESKRMMKGHKMDLFLLWLSFIGWGILLFFSVLLLTVFLFGIGLLFIFGILWLMPYIYTTTAVFYEKISNNDYKKENTTF